MSCLFDQGNGIARGHTFHQRLRPGRHSFQYPLYYACVDLDHADEFSSQLKSSSWFPWLRLKPADYLGRDKRSLKEKALAKLADYQPDYQPDKIIMLCQLRCFGLFFSPVNFVLFGKDGQFDWMLAEVSNTPWLEKHYYCLDLNHLKPHDKCFHVSPFNPIDMQYRWHIELAEQIDIRIECWREDKEFVAGLKLTPELLSQSSLADVKRKHPVQTLQVVFGIYAQAFRLWLKKMPFYDHPKSQQDT